MKLFRSQEKKKDSLLKELDSDAREALKWLASEYQYTLEVVSDLTELKQSLHDMRAARKLERAAISNLRYASLSQKRDEKYIHNLENDLHRLANRIPQDAKQNIKNLEESIEVAARKLILALSEYEGEVRAGLRSLDNALYILERCSRFLEKSRGESREAEWKRKENDAKILVRETTQNIITKIDVIIEWIRGLSVEIKNVKKSSTR